MDMPAIVKKVSQLDAKSRPFYARKAPRPLSVESIAKLQGPDGKPLPAELATWLAFDASWLPLVAPKRKKLAFEPLEGLLARYAREMEAADQEFIEELQEDLGKEEVDLLDFWTELLGEKKRRLPGLDAKVIELGCGEGSQEHFLTVDKNNKVKILGFHKRIEFWWKYDSLSALVAHWFLDIEPAA